MCTMCTRFLWHLYMQLIHVHCHDQSGVSCLRSCTTQIFSRALSGCLEGRESCCPPISRVARDVATYLIFSPKALCVTPSAYIRTQPYVNTHTHTPLKAASSSDGMTASKKAGTKPNEASNFDRNLRFTVLRNCTHGLLN